MRKSGAEPTFDLRPWSRAVNSDNCYDYAMNDFETRRNVKSTPGDRKGLSSNNLNIRNCGNLRRRILADNPKTVYACKNPNKVCKRGYYKIMNFVVPDGTDFHFYKQVGAVRYKVKTGDTMAGLARFFKVKPYTIKKTGPLTPGRTITFPVNLWAHKQGWGAPPLLTDAKGKTIRDPRKAARNYPGLNYSKFCRAYCVKRDQAVTGSRSKPGLKYIR